VRADGMDKDSPILASLPAVTMNWGSPIMVDPKKNAGRQVRSLLKSSENSWLSSSSEVQPDFQRYPDLGFAGADEMASQLLAVSVQGSFQSYYADKDDPRAQKPEESDKKVGDFQEEDLTEAATVQGASDKELKKELLPQEPVLKKSPDSARLVVVGSAEFINDTVISISQSMSQERYLNSLSFIQNIIDWSVEDEELLEIRSRGSQARLLYPLSHAEQTIWEWLNYGIVAFALLLVSLYGGWRRKRERPMELVG